jgi:mRNA interferase MazF
MVEHKEILTRGGIYLARLDPAKENEVGKIRPVVILTSQIILNVTPPHVFVCPLSSQSKREFTSLHVELPARDNLLAISYALAEHCRSISIKRVIYPRLANVTEEELSLILHRLQKLIVV